MCSQRLCSILNKAEKWIARPSKIPRPVRGIRLQPATPAPTSNPIVVRECHQDLVQAFICRLDYCNSMLFGISDELLRHLQSVWPHHTSVMAAALAASPSTQMRSRSRAELIHQSLVGAAPTYFADDCCLLSDVVVTHCGPTPMTCGSCSCREHITNSVTGVSRLPVLNCGTTSHQTTGLTFDSIRQSLKSHLFGDRSTQGTLLNLQALYK